MAADASSAQGDSQIRTVTIEMAYEDALRLWVLVHDPTNAGAHRADPRIRKLVHDAIGVVESDYEAEHG